VFDVSKLRIGLEQWKSLESELSRIAEGGQLELVVNFSLEGQEDFEKEVGQFVEYVVEKYGAHAHPHLHHGHGSVLFGVRGAPDYLLKALRDLLEYAKSCEKCSVHGIDGEFHLGEDLAGIYFGDIYKLTFLLPASDGRRLKVYEVHP